ncbi:hypothetical protein FQR65_LT17868 [Abscondita terminalis]|nr:hypothetical protein FQR65_LT17868 [Abscondita terminalis]
MLFAAGYSACFDSALNLVIKSAKIQTGETTVTAKVGIGQIENGGFGLEVELHANIPGVTIEEAQDLIEKASDHRYILTSYVANKHYTFSGWKCLHGNCLKKAFGRALAQELLDPTKGLAAPSGALQWCFMSLRLFGHFSLKPEWSINVIYLSWMVLLPESLVH